MALNMTNSPVLGSESCHESTFKLIRHHQFYFQSEQLGPAHIPDWWRMCTMSYSNPRWRTAISYGQGRSSKIIYYVEMHRQTVEKLT
jgi:hypothetical protein